jgi:hypothetical protein
MPDASTQTEENLAPTRRPLSDASKKKYDQAIKRIKDAGFDIEKDVKDVIAWIKTKGSNPAQLTYYSALKYELGKLDKPFTMPKAYQDEIDRLAGIQNAKQGDQELSEKQTENFVPYEDLLKIQQRLANKEDKSDTEWRKYLITSLYTLQPPVRADYGEMRIFKKRGPSRTGNELIYGQKKGAPVFVFREDKTKGTYGNVEVRVSPALNKVLGEWFAHLGKTPKYLLGRAITPNNLLNEIQGAFSQPSKKLIGINLLRHAYIKHHFPGLTTIKQKEDLAMMMLHSKDKQEQYNSQNV